MAKITGVKAREILDSRGIPTVETAIWLDTRQAAVASVPAGTSTGKYEAVELRDGDQQRFAGMGVLKAVTNVNEVIAPKLVGLDPSNQQAVDQMMIDMDGTPNKSKLGANAILSVSQAVCEVAAAASGVPIYKYLLTKYSLAADPMRMPTPIFNVINGGKHGAGNLDFQEFHIIPNLRYSYSIALECGEEIYQTLGKVLEHRGAIHSVGAEGGYAPNLFTNRDAIEVLVETIKQTKYVINRDVFLGLDVAASSFAQNGTYQIKDSSQPFTATAMMDFYKSLNQEYHLISIEDPFTEDDWASWSELTQELAGVMVVGDDLLGTNKQRLQKAVTEKAGNAILVKPNQIGTISETVEVIAAAKKSNWKVIVSHRSGETNDDFIADFAVGLGSDYTKFGAPSRGERVAKYNRLLQIESETTPRTSPVPNS